MPSKQGSGQKRAQGGGRTPNSEPKLQVFKEFGGVNFELANRFDNGMIVDSDNQDYTDQTDLQMNFMFLQNNVSVCSNKSLEVRNDIITMFDAPDDFDFTGPVCLYGPKLYIAKSDGNMSVVSIDDRFESDEPIVANENIELRWGDILIDWTPEWLSIFEYDNKIIANAIHRPIVDPPIEEYTFWIGDLDGYDINKMVMQGTVLDPIVSLEGSITPMGTLQINDTFTQEYPFRIEIAYSYVTRLGPTKTSPVLTFYANHPVSEWDPSCYLHIENSAPVEDEFIQAIELYYSSDNAMQLLFFGRTDSFTQGDDEFTRNWSYDWFGYIDATNMWPTANLIPPTENYSGGPNTTHMTCIDGRMYFWGDLENEDRLYIGGNPGNLLSISPGTGGGFVDIEPGTGQVVRHVCKYKTQSGNSIVTMLCASPNTTKDQRYNLVEDTISLSNEQSMKSWNAEQVAGAVGCKSFDGALVCEDGLYSVNKYGLALTTMTMEYNSQIRTNYVSDVIKPVFIDGSASDRESRLTTAAIIEIDGVIYMAFGSNSDENGNLDNVLFCYDIDLKAWWTYTLDVNEPILKMFHIDWQGQPEGIGIVTGRHVYMLPTKGISDEMTKPMHEFLIESAQISTQMPQQSWQYLSQLEFHFDYLVGDVDFEVRMIDMFGRKLNVKKHVSEDEMAYDDVIRMRIDQRVMSYVITIKGQARFRLTHFIARVYTLSNKIGQVWGFDDSISHRSAGSVQPTFKCYNDVRRAIFI